MHRCEERGVHNQVNGLILEHDPQTMYDIGACGLLGNGLDLVPLRKGGSDAIKRQVECTRHPEEERLDYNATDELDGWVRVR